MVLECSASLGIHVPRALTSVPRITHCMCVAGASLCSYSAPGLRWFLVSIRETRLVWVCGVRGAGNLTTMLIQRACVARVLFCVAQRPRIYGVVVHLPVWVDPRAAVRA